MKPINLKHAVERKGVHAVNVFMSFGKLVKFDLFITIECAWLNHKQGECYTLSIENAVKQFPQYFEYK